MREGVPARGAGEGECRPVAQNRPAPVGLSQGCHLGADDRSVSSGSSGLLDRCRAERWTWVPERPPAPRLPGRMLSRPQQQPGRTLLPQRRSRPDLRRLLVGPEKRPRRGPESRHCSGRKCKRPVLTRRKRWRPACSAFLNTSSDSGCGGPLGTRSGPFGRPIENFSSAHFRASRPPQRSTGSGCGARGREKSRDFRRPHTLGGFAYSLHEAPHSLNGLFHSPATVTFVTDSSHGHLG